MGKTRKPPGRKETNSRYKRHVTRSPHRELRASNKDVMSAMPGRKTMISADWHCVFGFGASVSASCLMVWRGPAYWPTTQKQITWLPTHPSTPWVCLYIFSRSCGQFTLVASPGLRTVQPGFASCCTRLQVTCPMRRTPLAFQVCPAILWPVAGPSHILSRPAGVRKPATNAWHPI